MIYIKRYTLLEYLHMLYEYDITNSIFGCMEFSAKGEYITLLLRLDRNLYLMFTFHDFPAYFIHLKTIQFNQSIKRSSIQYSAFLFLFYFGCSLSVVFSFLHSNSFLQGK